MPPFVSRYHAAHYLGISVDSFDLYVRPHLKEVRYGRRILFDQDDLDRCYADDSVFVRRPFSTGHTDPRDREK